LFPTTQEQLLVEEEICVDDRTRESVQFQHTSLVKDLISSSSNKVLWYHGRHILTLATTNCFVGLL
jgi:hypothetical protein